MELVLKIITTFNGLASAFRFTLLNEGILSDDMAAIYGEEIAGNGSPQGKGEAGL